MAKTKDKRSTVATTAPDSNASNTAPEAPQAVNATENIVTSNGTSNTKQGERKIMALTPDQIQQLLGQTRTKGQYTEMLNEFLASGDGGVCANEQWVAIRDKKSSTIKQGFENAKDKKDAVEGAANVKVLVNEDKVYLINLAAANVAVDEAAA